MANRDPWWHVDKNGRRIGFMEPIEFESILAGYYGDRDWVRKFAAQFDFSLPTIYRYNQGFVPIPKTVALIVLMIHELGGPERVPEIDAPWLPPRKAPKQPPKTPAKKKTKPKTGAGSAQKMNSAA